MVALNCRYLNEDNMLINEYLINQIINYGKISDTKDLIWKSNRRSVLLYIIVSPRIQNTIP